MNTSYSNPSFNTLQIDLGTLSKEQLSERYSLNQLKSGMMQVAPAQGVYYGTLYHWCAETGNLWKLPEELLTKKTLIENPTDGDKNNPLQLAIEYKNFHQIPEELITEENLLVTNGFDQNCFHYIFRHGQFQQKAAAKFFTEKNMTIPDYNGTTPFYWAANRQNIHQVPKEFLQASTLLEMRNLSGDDDRNFMELAASKGTHCLHLIPMLDFDTLCKIQSYYQASSALIPFTQLPTVFYDHDLNITGVGRSEEQNLRKDILEWVAQRIESHAEKRCAPLRKQPKENPAVMEALREAFAAVKRFQDVANACKKQSEKRNASEFKNVGSYK
jgi:hypothetical protein